MTYPYTIPIHATVLPRLVVCAAIQKEGRIICGLRHLDMIMRNQLLAVDARGGHGWEQGFMDNRGAFMSREEALTVAKVAGQIRRRCGGDERQLFSENLY